MTRRLSIAVLAAASVTAPQALSQAPAPSLVIEAARAVTATGAPPVLDAAIVVSGSRITYVGPRTGRPESGQAPVIRAPKGTVLPGLIDSHVHFRPWMPRLFVQFGVTSVLDTGNPTDEILRQRERLEKGDVIGPRLFLVGLGVSASGPDGPGETGREYVTTEEDARRAARARLARGADAIKINGWFAPALVQAIVEEARRAGKPVLGHLAVAADQAIAAGLTCLVHPYGLDLSTNDDPAIRAEIARGMPAYQARTEYYPFHLMDPRNYPRVIRLMVERRTFFNPTYQSQFRGILHERQPFEEYDRRVLARIAPAFPELSQAKEPLLPYYTQPQSHPIADSQRRTLEEGMAKVARFMREFQQAGGTLVAGTDTSRIGIPGLRMHRELELWVRIGIPPMEAIRAATQYSAQLLHQDDRLGTLEAGRLADLLVVDGDPLTDITVTKNILHVIQDGKIVRRPE